MSKRQNDIPKDKKVIEQEKNRKIDGIMDTERKTSNKEKKIQIKKIQGIIKIPNYDFSGGVSDAGKSDVR